MREDTNVSVPKANSNPKSSDNGKDDNKDKKAGGASSAAGNLAAGAAAMEGTKVAALAGMTNAAQGVATGFLQGLANSVMGFVNNVVGHVVGAVQTAVNAVASVFGAAVNSIAAIGTAFMVGVTSILGMFGIGTTVDEATVFNHTLSDIECRTMTAGESGADAGYSLLESPIIDNAYVIYYSLTGWGMNHNQAVGVLVNMYHESCLYPSMVQGHWGDPYYGQSISDPSTYTDHGGGVGLVQWTPIEAKQQLNNCKGSYNWYDLEYQVSFMLSSNDVNWNTTNNYVASTNGKDAIECSRWFLKYWERCAGAQTASTHMQHGDVGTNYYNRWTSAPTDVDEMEAAIAYFSSLDTAGLDAQVQTILDLTTDMEEGSATNATAATACVFGTYDNSSIASAAVSYSWANKREAYNNGTALYQMVYNAILSDRTYYKSCDRNVICAVCWSGADDTFATLGGVEAQYTYLSSGGDGKWSYVGKIGSGISISDCQPGDLLIITASQRGTQHGHVVIYTGPEMITQVHGTNAPSGANVIAASYLDYTPCAQAWSDSTAAGYSVYRCTAPMNSTTYAGAGGYVDPDANAHEQ